jgi:hypothetical protein
MELELITLDLEVGISRMRGSGPWMEMLSGVRESNIECSNEILGWEGVGNRQLLCFFKA